MTDAETTPEIEKATAEIAKITIDAVRWTCGCGATTTNHHPGLVLEIAKGSAATVLCSDCGKKLRVVRSMILTANSGPNRRQRKALHKGG